MLFVFTILGVLGSFLCAGLALFTLLRNPRHLANIGFMLGMSALALVEAGSAAVFLLPLGPGFLTTGTKIFFMGLAALPSAWLLFSIVFARSNYKDVLLKWAPVLALSTVASVFFIVKSGSLYQLAALPGTVVPYPFLTGLGRYFCVFLIIGAVLNLVHLENTLRCSRGSNRWHVKYLIFGIGSLFAYFIYVASQSLLFSTLKFEIFLLTSIVILIAASFMAVYIVKHRLLDFDIFISRYFIYNSVTVLAVGVYLVAVGLVTHGIRYFELPYGGFFSTLFIFIAALFLFMLLFAASLRRKAQLFINRHFYKHKYEFRDKWMETVEKITPRRSVPEVCQTLTELISETMLPTSMRLWIFDPVSKGYIHYGDDRAPSGMERLSPGGPFIAALRERLAPFSVDEAKTKGAHGIFLETGSVLCSPLVAGGELIGFLLLGPDKSGARYIKDDDELLKAVSTQAAVQIKEIMLLEELTMAKELEAFSKMSSFIMHDLKNLTNSLSLISQNAQQNMDNPEFQRDTIRTIDGTVSRMKKVIEMLSNVPRELVFTKKPVNIDLLVENSLRKAARPVEKEITLRKDVAACPPVLVDPDALEMVILNLILNAFDAIPQSGYVDLKASSDSEFVNISVEDTGRGMTADYMQTSLFRPFKSTKKNGLGIGLFQCKSIIEAHGGSIDVKSSPGAGTRFIVKLPAHSSETRG